jgi:acyl dehydratase
MRRFTGPDQLRAAAGQHLGYTGWFAIDQDRINKFADATGDHQWIHVDPQRAAAGPFGATIAHGYLTLSLVPLISQQIYAVDGVKLVVNYGLDRVRFPTPVPVDSQVRGGVELISVSDVEGGLQAAARVTIELQGSPKPCCVAETLARIYV